MDDGLKQRLIGAIILLALAVIFVPLIFDRERMEPVDKVTRIPIAPIVEPLVVATPRVDSAEDAVVVADEMFVPNENAPEESLETTELPYDSNGVPNSWVLQIASFRIAKHAEDLRDKLIAGGHPAYTKSVSTSKGQMTRVYVGPKLEKAVLIEHKNTIESEYKLSAILRKFSP